MGHCIACCRQAWRAGARDPSAQPDFRCNASRWMGCLPSGSHSICAPGRNRPPRPSETWSGRQRNLTPGATTKPTCCIPGPCVRQMPCPGKTRERTAAFSTSCTARTSAPMRRATRRKAAKSLRLRASPRATSQGSRACCPAWHCNRASWAERGSTSHSMFQVATLMARTSLAQASKHRLRAGSFIPAVWQRGQKAGCAKRRTWGRFSRQGSCEWRHRSVAGRPGTRRVLRCSASVQSVLALRRDPVGAQSRPVPRQ